MKRLSKILMLVLVLTLSCALFGTLASAEDAAVTDGTLFTVEKDGVVTEYPTGTALTNALVNGGKVVLYQDMTVSELISGAVIDLNGHALTATATFLGGGSTLKSSAPGAVVYGCLGATHEKASESIANGSVTIGTADSERITLYVNKINCHYDNNSRTTTITNCDLFNMTAHPTNQGVSWFGRPSWSRWLTVSFNNCNIYAVGHLTIASLWQPSQASTMNFTDTNLYGDIDILGAPSKANGDATRPGLNVTMTNSHMYGGVDLNLAGVNHPAILTADATSTYSANELPALTEGQIYSVAAGVGSVTYPAGGVAGGAATTFNLSSLLTYGVSNEPANFTVDGVSYAGNLCPAHVNGKTIVLQNDTHVDAALTNVKVDLNGHALVAKGGLTTGGTSVFYNSSENTASVYVSNGNTLNAQYDNVYFGYSAAGVKYEGGRIFVAAYQLGAGQRVSSYYYNCDLVNVNAAWTRPSDGSSGRGSWQGGYNMGGSMNFDRCNLYMPIQTRIVHGNAGNFKLNFKDSNIYAAAGGQFTGYNDNAGKGGPVACTFDNSTVWGAFTWNGYDNASFPWTFTNGSKFYTALGSTQYTLPDGSVVAGAVETKTVTYTYAPTYGAEPVTFSHTLSTNYEVGAAGDYDFTANNVYYKAAGFLPENINGKNVVLLSNITTDQTFSNLKIDLNGYDLTCTGARFVDGTYNYIYNNAETASNFIAGSVIGNGVDSQRIAVYFGYEDNGQTQAKGRITMNLSSQFLPARNYATVYFNNVDFVNTVERNYTKDSGGVFYSRMDRGLTLNINNCNFYAVESTALMCGNQMSASSYSITIANTSFYGPFAVFAGCSTQRGGTNTATFNNVHFYNGAYIFGNGASMSYAHMITPVLDENCTFDVAEGQIKENLPEGMQIVPTHLSETVNFVYGDGENDKFTGTFTSRYKYGTEADVKAIFRTFYRNINIDVNINFNLYVPVEYTYALDGLKGATHTGTLVIGGKTYNVLTVKQAPKDAHTPVGVTLYGGHVTYSADVVGYTKSLLKLADTTEYNKDSKMMAKYILYYIKETAVAAQVEADFTAIDTLLDGFTLSEEDKALTENVGNTANLGTALARAYLDLSSNVGIVLQVKDGFVGTIKVTMAGMEPITKTYTADAPAGAEEYIIIGDIPVYDFRNTITVEVDGAVVGTYNLATYVNNKKTDVAYATYAYSKAAYDYQIKHGNPSTAD